jgi:ribosome-associated heat shock protein Hsp15
MTGEDSARIDKWLWAARFFKTRQLAIDAINAGRVLVNNARIKPAKAIRLGDVIQVRKPPYTWDITVRLLSDRRGSAVVAHTLYEEAEQSVAAREVLKNELKDMPPPLFPGRPTKRDRRALDKFMQQHADE